MSLQSDNCWRENKNQYVLGFCAFLLHLEYAVEVFQCFLMVGHSHGDCDQFFSKMGPLISRNGALSILDLESCIKECDAEKLIHIHHIIEVIDFRSFLKSFLNQICNTSKPLNYHFKINPESKEIMFRSRLFSNTTWTDFAPIFKVAMNKNDIPRTTAIEKHVNSHFHRYKKR